MTLKLRRGFAVINKNNLFPYENLYQSQHKITIQRYVYYKNLCLLDKNKSIKHI